MFFFAVYFSILSCKGVGLWGIKNMLFLNVLHWSLAVVTMFSRAYLGYHTVAQVFAGATLGILVGAGWFWVVNSVLFRYFPDIEESALGKYFCLNHIPNVLKFEYDNARVARNKAYKSN
ncbi:hypothetical protein ACOSP7_003154 [Xanthoceras sorbifolium]|uniref:Phosphatidic acid phosphatase type 2/haloperoxidase domain-containing protein n=1 Tax=Xanthoceras sorbifolium TaxID=99658 RepID=A0ABQ8IIL0_9ROSI|nr:hypothetical protein JRO89_XS01G0084000 [Xanthoceras sorbifolium]